MTPTANPSFLLQAIDSEYPLSTEGKHKSGGYCALGRMPATLKRRALMTWDIRRHTYVQTGEYTVWELR